VTYGPWLVGLGAALWGTESAWRIPLNNLFDADVIVFWEHVLILLIFLPLLLSRVGEIRKIDARTWGYLILSGFAGSAVGTIFFTLALKYGNPTVVNVVLNIQPVISTMGAFLLFSDRLAPRFFLCRHRDPCWHLRLGCASNADRRLLRACRAKPRHWLCTHLRPLLGACDCRWARRYDRNVTQACVQSADRRWTYLHDADPSRL